MTDKYAYVALLNGDNIYFLGALVFGYSLKKNTNHDKILMVTPDVPDKQKKILQDVYDIILDIDYVEVDHNLIIKYEENRFKDMFTKLQCLQLTQYSKIIMIDIDMYVLGNMDDLFKLSPPAASVRTYTLPHNTTIPKHLIYRNNELVGGINAGVMLLKPDKQEYNEIIKDVYENPKGKLYYAPEQEYLSERYYDTWTNISFIYNFQFSLFHRAKKYKFREIRCIHYSWLIKPWFLVVDPKNFWKRIDYLRFDRKYYEIWMNAYHKLYKKYQIKGINLDELYVHPEQSKLDILLQKELPSMRPRNNN